MRTKLFLSSVLLCIVIFVIASQAHSTSNPSSSPQSAGENPQRGHHHSHHHSNPHHHSHPHSNSHHHHGHSHGHSNEHSHSKPQQTHSHSSPQGTEYSSENSKGDKKEQVKMTATSSDLHDHSHESSHHDSHNSHRGHSHGDEFSKKFQQSRFFKTALNYYENSITNIYLRACLSIFLISTPSVPIFFLISFIASITSKSDNDMEKVGGPFIEKMISFAFGTLLGDVFLHLFPHLFMEQTSSDSIFGEFKVYFFILNGIIFFWVLDLIIIFFLDEKESHNHGHNKKVEPSPDPIINSSVKEPKNKKNETQEIRNRSQGNPPKIIKSDSHEHKDLVEEHKDQSRASTYLFLMGDFAHNFADGLAVGAAFMGGTALGITTTLAITLHEIPHEIGDFAFLIKKKYKTKTILLTQVITSTGALLGGLISLKWGSSYKDELISITCGGFLYLCLCGLLPEIKEELEKKRSLLSLFINLILIYSGIYLMYLMTFIE